MTMITIDDRPIYIDLMAISMGPQGIKGDPGSPGEGWPTRAGMAGAAATNGDDTYLSEAGREGKFIYTTSNISAAVTLDVGQGIYVPRSADPTGATGGWKRVHSGVVFAAWAGVIADGSGNHAPAINGLLALAEVGHVILPIGTVGVNKCVEVPSGKKLTGFGQDKSVLKATNTTGYSGQPLLARNGMVGLLGYGATCADFSLDGNKLGSHLIGGVHAIEAKAFLCERVTARNCSGYAFWATTNLNYTPEFTSGVFRNCWSYNANVHFETTAATNILFDRCHARDGDGDIGVETYFHPISGSKDITYRDCSAMGTAGATALIGSYTAEPVERVRFENCKMKATGGGICMSVISFASPIKDMKVIDCDIDGATYFGLYLENVAGEVDVEVQGGRIVGHGVVVTVDNDCSAILRGTKLVCKNVSAAATVYPVSVGPTADLVIIDGITVDTDRAFAYPILMPRSPAIKVVQDPLYLLPFPETPPWGVGHKVKYTLAADSTHGAAFTTVGVGTADEWTVSSLDVGVYKVTVEGVWQSTATTNGIYIANQPYGAQTWSGTASIDSALSGAAHTERMIGTGGTYVGARADTVAQANQSYPFKMEFFMTVTAVDPAIIIDASGFNAGGSAGTAKVMAGSTLTVEKVR